MSRLSKHVYYSSSKGHKHCKWGNVGTPEGVSESAMAAKTHSVKQRMMSLTLPELHYALMDFLVSRIGKENTNRTELIRQAIESYVPQHRFWDPKAFEEFVAERAEQLDNPALREILLKDLEIFVEKRVGDGGKVFRMAEPWELGEFGISAGSFKW